jgi:hypothetical protein
MLKVVAGVALKALSAVVAKLPHVDVCGKPGLRLSGTTDRIHCVASSELILSFIRFATCPGWFPVRIAWCRSRSNVAGVYTAIREFHVR